MFGSALLAGCFGEYQLVAFGQASYVNGWHQYEKPRPPLNEAEEAVITVARTKKKADYADSEILFVVTDYTKEKPVHVVDIVGKPLSNTAYPERLVSRYRISDGLIIAMSDPAYEFYVDADLERAILRAIARTWAADRVIIYNNGTSSVAIASHAINRCTADIKLFNGGASSGTALAEKRVAFCFAR
jgi:hypothetical protein